MVAARHLFFYGYKPVIFYPKRSKNELYQVSPSIGPGRVGVYFVLIMKCRKTFYVALHFRGLDMYKC